jgi:GNAT superfamily N-acetyltransferase
VTSASVLLSNECAKHQLNNLIKSQWGEVDVRSNTSCVDVDFEKYIEMDKLGLHFVAVAYTNDKLVGYMSIILSESPHNKELLAITDSIFISEDFRGSGLGSSLIKEVESECKLRGVKDLLLTFKEDHPHHQIITDSGFTKYEVVYSKHIGG